ncbi:hypothetical protein PQR10_13870 [Paraburkholderia phytofirmans]|uniref:Uncharacterized protein n=1 Tax=Paraburkholderia phytofirmans TaxID=261302 RepID=A0ABW9BAK1_9BURK
MTSVIPVRATRFSRTRSNQRRYVCVEALQARSTLAIYIFLHDDGMWCVFPPDAGRPVMSVL